MSEKTKQIKQVKDRLEHEISVGVKRPNEKLPEDQLAEEYETESKFVRLALSELESTGLVKRFRNSAMVVREYSDEELRQTLKTRRLLEAGAARVYGLPCEPSILERLQETLVAQRTASDEDDVEAFNTANNAFNEILFGYCGNRFLSDAIAFYSTKTASVRQGALRDPRIRRQMFQVTRDIHDALRNADRNALLEACLRQVDLNAVMNTLR